MCKVINRIFITKELTKRVKDGWTGSVVWPGTELMPDEELSLKHWAWGGGQEHHAAGDGPAGVSAGVSPGPVGGNQTRRGRRQTGQQRQETGDKNVLETEGYMEHCHSFYSFLKRLSHETEAAISSMLRLSIVV